MLKRNSIIWVWRHICYQPKANYLALQGMHPDLVPILITIPIPITHVKNGVNVKNLLKLKCWQLKLRWRLASIRGIIKTTQTYSHTLAHKHTHTHSSDHHTGQFVDKQFNNLLCNLRFSSNILGFSKVNLQT